MTRTLFEKEQKNIVLVTGALTRKRKPAKEIQTACSDWERKIRESGQATPPFSKKLGANPNLEHRDPAVTPAGLRNLGATCYLNSLIQGLFHNRAFRAGVYKCAQEFEGQGVDTHSKVLAELRLLFGRMQMSARKAVNPSEFVKMLGLDQGMQQDPQELSKLFLALLESLFGRSTDPSLQQLLPQLFQGTLRYLTKCNGCGRQHGDPTPFCELELQVRGQPSVMESLQHYLSIEQLTGDNRYYCEACGTKRDADRRAVLDTLPKVLSVQLLRYIYDMKISAKKKLKNAISIPEMLNMTGFATNGCIYHLKAVLYHKGVSAYGGHYIAEVYDESTRSFWIFDDENVTLPSTKTETGSKKENEEKSAKPVKAVRDSLQSLSDHSDESVPAKAGVQGQKGKSKKRALSIDSDSKKSTGSSGKGKQGESTNKPPKVPKKEAAVVSDSSVQDSKTACCSSGDDGCTEEAEDGRASRDAYMLIFHSEKNAVLAEPEVPADIRCVVQSENEEFEAEIAVYNSRLMELQKQIEDRKKCYAEFLGDMNHQTPVEGSSYGWVETSWLQSWVTGERVTATTTSDSNLPADSNAVIEIDEDAQRQENNKHTDTDTEVRVFTDPMENKKFLCDHQKISPEKIPMLKRVSDLFYSFILECCGADVALWGPNMHCAECEQMYRDARCQSLCNSETKQALITALEKDEAQMGIPVQLNGNVIYPTKCFIVSRAWITQLKQQFGKGIKSSDISTLLVPQEAKILDETVNAAITCQHQQLVTNRRRWRYVDLETWNLISAFFPQAIKYPGTTKFCSECKQSEENNSEQKKVAKECRLAEMQEGGKDIEKLAKRGKERWCPTMFDSMPWIHDPSLEALTNKRFFIVSSAWLSTWRTYIKDTTSDQPLGLPTNDPIICAHHGTTILPQYMDSYLFKLCDTKPQCFEYEIIEESQWDFFTKVYGTGTKVILEYNDEWQFDPPLDRACMDENYQTHLEIQKSFRQAPIKVVHLKDGQEPPEAMSKEQSLVNRRSSRTRTGTTASVILNSDDTLCAATLKIIEVFPAGGPSQLKIYFGGNLLDCSSTTLKEYNVRANSTLYIKIDESGNPEEDAFFYGHLSDDRPSATERGFQGSVFFGEGLSQNSVETIPVDDVDEEEEMQRALKLSLLQSNLSSQCDASNHMASEADIDGTTPEIEAVPASEGKNNKGQCEESVMHQIASEDEDMLLFERGKLQQGQACEEMDFADENIHAEPDKENPTATVIPTPDNENGLRMGVHDLRNGLSFTIESLKEECIHPGFNQPEKFKNVGMENFESDDIALMAARNLQTPESLDQKVKVSVLANCIDVLSSQKAIDELPIHSTKKPCNNVVEMDENEDQPNMLKDTYNAQPTKKNKRKNSHHDHQGPTRKSARIQQILPEDEQEVQILLETTKNQAQVLNAEDEDADYKRAIANSLQDISPKLKKLHGNEGEWKSKNCAKEDKVSTEPQASHVAWDLISQGGDKTGSPIYQRDLPISENTLPKQSRKNMSPPMNPCRPASIGDSSVSAQPKSSGQGENRTHEV